MFWSGIGPDVGTSSQVANNIQFPVKFFSVQLLISSLTSDNMALDVPGVWISYKTCPTPLDMSMFVKNGATIVWFPVSNENGVLPVYPSKVKYPSSLICKYRAEVGPVDYTWFTSYLDFVFNTHSNRKCSSDHCG